jgi:hypothetical protein
VDLDAIKRNPAHLLVLLKDCGLQQFGGSWRARCPVHGGDRLSLGIYRDRRGVVKWNCFACGEKGDVFYMVMLLDSCNFKTALATVTGERQVERASLWRPPASGTSHRKRTRIEVTIPCEDFNCRQALRVQLEDVLMLREGYPSWDFETEGLFYVWAWCPTHHRSVRTGRPAASLSSVSCESGQLSGTPSSSEPATKACTSLRGRAVSGPEPTVVGPQTREAP